MKYDLTNPTKAPRIIYDGAPMREIRIAPGETLQGLDLTEAMAVRLIKGMEGDGDCLAVEAHDPNRAIRDASSRPAIVLDGRFGIGDAIHQRGIIRELMRDHDVWLKTCHFRVYEDMVARGLKLIFKPTHLHAQAKTIERERAVFPQAPAPPSDAPQFNLSYGKPLIDQHGSIVEAMAGSVGVKARPLDFSLPVRPEWTAGFRRRFTLDAGGRPIMVYRPIVQRREWNGASRNPDPHAYEAIFKAARDGFFVVSVADLEPNVEWIVGPEAKADVALHKGELTFEDMAALWREAAIVFCNAGFAPVLAQAVGTPSIVVYGGRECYRTTQRAGAHLAPTLGVDPDRPCDCMSERHACDKTITLKPAIEKATSFANRMLETAQASRRRQEGLGDAKGDGGGAKVLVFATTYVDSGDREVLTKQWLDLHVALNPECHFLMVDSASPKPVLSPKWRERFAAEPQRFRLFDFGDNVGHLSRRGRDGWGRAFCHGLDYAVERGYEHVLHIEGDSLLRTPARDIVATLKKSGKGCATIPVRGTARDIPGWVETGLMCFSTDYLQRSGFTAKYDWKAREVRPTPEFVVFKLVAHDLHMLDLIGLRGDKNQISAANIVKMNLDWVTHTHSDIWVYDKFVEANLPATNHEHQENVSPCSSLLSPCSVAVVVGGGGTVMQEIEATEALLSEAGATARWFVANDMIGRFPHACTAITLHPQKLKGWVAERERAGYPKPVQVWAHVKHVDVSHVTEDWRGSSGLFAVKIALKLGFRRVILCGVPMEADAGHFVRGPAPWKASEQFRPGWLARQREIAPHVRSWSGWTAKTFGRPELEFLASADAVRAA